MITKKEISEAYAFLRTNNQSISDEVLDFINEAAKEKLDNENLFAAAPDLLKALQELIYELTGEQECEEELEKGLGWQLALKVKYAKAAIAKATKTTETNAA